MLQVKYKIKKVIILIILFSIVLLPSSIFAQEPEPGETGPSYLDRLVGVATPAYGYDEPATPQFIAVVIINTILFLLGSIFIIIIIAAGYQWMTSGGNEEKIKHARDRIKNAIIGLIIIMLSLIIVNFLIIQLVNINQLYT